MNRETRRAIERAAKAARKPQRQSTKVIPINPLFAMDPHCRNKLAIVERKAMDALLEHHATKDDIEQIETLLEASIRAVNLAKAEGAQHLDAEALDAAVKVFNRAAWSIKHAKARHKEVGVYGLSASDRDALIQADQLIAEMRKPGVITRKTWLAAFRESYAGNGVVIPAFEELETT
jgi:hypothetical protein